MKKINFARYGLLAVLLLAIISVSAQYNKNPTLKIGDPAPPIKVQAWVRGEPLTKFEKGKVYVIDFWATWCGGCIASFPHISAIAEKYKGKASFNSVSVYEAIDEKKIDPIVKVTSFLKTPQGQNLKFGVCVDGNSNMMFDAWIKPLRRNGLPTTFIIDQEGKIAWIDVNLDHLDWALEQVLANKWDRNKAADIMKQKDALEDKVFAIFRDTIADHKKDYQEMIATSEDFEKQYPDRKDAVAFYKFMALLRIDMEKVPSILEQMATDPRSRYINLADAAALTLRITNLSKRTYAAVAMVQERLLLNEYPGTGYGGKSIAAYESLANTYENAGDNGSAIVTIKKAITMANEQKAPAEQLKKLQETLGSY